MFRRNYPPPNDTHQENAPQYLPITNHQPQHPPPNNTLPENDELQTPNPPHENRPPTPASPSLQSRHPRSPTSQTLHTAATTWLADPARTAHTCPTAAVTSLILANTSTGTTLLSKFAPAKLTLQHSDMRARDRVLMVGDLRAEVLGREERAQTWRAVGRMAEAQGWEGLREACEGALGLVGELRGCLGWCEREFEGKGADGGEFVPRRAGEAEEEGFFGEIWG